MKSYIEFMGLALIATFFGCTAGQVETEVVSGNGTVVTLKAGAESLASKASLSDSGEFAWQEGDRIGVYAGDAFVPFTLSSEAGSGSGIFTGTLAGGQSIQSAAVYPYRENASLSGTSLTFNLPATYAYSARNANAVMAAVIPDEAPESISMMHLAGVLKFTYTGVPANAKSFRFVAKEKKITGDFTVDLSASSPVLTTSSAISGCTVTITGIPAGQSSLDFYVPVPAGEYKGFFVSLYDEYGAAISGTARTAGNVTVEIARAEMVLTPALASGSLAYKTKVYGTKEWMVENCRETDEAGTLGKVQDLTFLSVSGVSEYVKARIGAASGRYYTWYEAMTGIPGCTPDQCPYVNGYSGIDDAGNAFTLDGTEAGEYNIQLKGVCPTGWHIANANDWWDLLNAIKTEYNVPDDFVPCGYTFNGGTDGNPANKLTRKKFYENGSTIKNTGNVGAWLRGGNGRILDGGVWNQANLKLNDAGKPYDQFTSGADAVGFGWYPVSRFNNSGSFNNSGIAKYAFIWTPARQSTSGFARPIIMSGTSLNLSTAVLGSGGTPRTEADMLGRLSVRCVRNY